MNGGHPRLDSVMRHDYFVPIRLETTGNHVGLETVVIRKQDFHRGTFVRPSNTRSAHAEL